jgi:hypothetical protein
MLLVSGLLEMNATETHHQLTKKENQTYKPIKLLSLKYAEHIEHRPTMVPCVLIPNETIPLPNLCNECVIDLTYVNF